MTDEDIDVLLQRGEEKTRKVNKEIDDKMSKHKNLLDLAMTEINVYEFENENYLNKKKQDERIL